MEPERILKLALDPGVHGLGYALGSHYRLISCGYHELGNYISLTQRAYTARRILDMYSAKYRDIKIYIERPIIREMKTPRNQDILDLTIIVGACILGDTTFVAPTDWKGTLDKEIAHNRLIPLLTKEELHIWNSGKPSKTLAHNTLDAIGILMWTQGRFGP